MWGREKGERGARGGAAARKGGTKEGPG